MHFPALLKVTTASLLNLALLFAEANLFFTITNLTSLFICYKKNIVKTIIYPSVCIFGGCETTPISPFY